MMWMGYINDCGCFFNYTWMGIHEGVDILVVMPLLALYN